MPTESPYRIEPCSLPSMKLELGDVVAEIVELSARLGQRLPARSADSLAKLVRVMNCYYSNLIEGHNTRPRDIERALKDDIESESERRELQLEARAHIRLQEQIDRQYARGALGEPCELDFVLWLHQQFYADATPSMLRITDAQPPFSMVPGELRKSGHEVIVGRHQPPSAEAVATFLSYFARRFALEPMGFSSRIIAVAIAHHRFNYIHPFPDGNGRVSRLISHAMALKSGIGAHGLWSVSRGLARGLGDRGEYKRHMDLADSPRRRDLDGRGSLSLQALEEFVLWFCRVMHDQLRFMTELFDFDALDKRLDRYITTELNLGQHASAIAREVLRRGELPRGEATRASGRPERTARVVLGKLLDAELLASSSPKGPVWLHFSASSADSLFPRLFLAQGD